MTSLLILALYLPNYSSATIQTLYTACNSRGEGKLEGLGGEAGKLLGGGGGGGAYPPLDRTLKLVLI